MNNIPQDLLFIAKHVTEWPEGEETVRLDADGEICFIPNGSADFFVEPRGTYEVFPGEEHPEFIPEGGAFRATGKNYTKEQWREARNENS